MLRVRNGRRQSSNSTPLTLTHVDYSRFEYWKKAWIDALQEDTLSDRMPDGDSGFANASRIGNPRLRP